jgi:hypothetical protein
VYITSGRSARPSPPSRGEGLARPCLTDIQKYCPSTAVTNVVTTCFQGRTRTPPAVKVVRPENLTWVIVDDREKIKKGVRELNIREVRVIDADGNPVK